ncbi:MMPL family transporter, partial [Candidatus Sumerlaeota bacterium]|nr:MMPL family transporter [Candidatus Sumerlaeota bacterium]
MRRLLLRMIAHLTTRAPILALSVCVVATVVAAISALRIFPIQSDILSLLPDSSPEALTYRRAVRQFGGFDYLLVVIESSRPDNDALLSNVASRFAEIVGQPNGFIQSVENAPSSQKLHETMPEMDWRRMPGLLTDAERVEIEQLLHSGRFLRAKLKPPVSAKRRNALLADPLGLERVGRHNRLDRPGPVHGPTRQGLLISEDGMILLMVLRPRSPATDLLFSQRLMRWLREQVSPYALQEAGADPIVCHIGFIGAHVLAAMDAEIAQRDFVVIAIAAFALVVALFIVAVGRVSSLLFVAAPLFAGVIWTLGLAGLFFRGYGGEAERLSIVTCIFGAALIGLGMDYAIHIYNRYLEERNQGAGVERAIETALCETGQGVVIGALATATGFFGMYFTHFEAFQQLAIVGATGILCCMLAMLLIPPALVVLSERTPSHQRLYSLPGSLGLGRMAATVQTYPHLTLLFGLIVTAWLGFLAGHVRFDDNVENLRERPTAYEDLMSRILNRRFELPAAQTVAIVSAKTLEDALYLNDLLYQRLEECKTSFSLLGYESLRPLLPSLRTQRHSQAALRAMLDRDAAGTRLQGVAKKEDLKTTVTAAVLEQLGRWRESASDEDLIEFSGELSPRFVQIVWQYVRRSRNSQVVTYIYPRREGWDDATRKKFAEYVRGVVPADLRGKPAVSVEFTGLVFVTDALKRLLCSNMARAVLLVVAMTYLLLVVTFRSSRKAIVAIV